MGKQKLWLHAVGLLRHMERESLEPNVITFNSSISSCEKGQQWLVALELLRQMRQRRLEPNVLEAHCPRPSVLEAHCPSVLASL